MGSDEHPVILSQTLKAYGLPSYSKFAVACGQTAGFVMIGAGLFWYGLLSGKMTVDQALSALAALHGLGALNFAINSAPDLGLPAGGAFFHGILAFAVSYLMYNGGAGDFSTQDIAKYYGLFQVLLGAIGYLYPVELLEKHGMKGEQCSDLTSVEMMKLQLTTAMMSGILLMNSHSSLARTIALAWIPNTLSCYIGMSAGSPKAMGMDSDVHLKVWFLIGAVFIHSALSAGVCF